MRPLEDLDKTPREPKLGADLLIEESTRRVIYRGCVLPISSRSQRRPSKSYLLLHSLCLAALFEGTPWVTTDVLAGVLWKQKEVDDTHKQLYTYYSEVRRAFGKLVGMHVKGFHSVPPTEDWDWILEGNGRQMRINYSAQRIDIAWQFIIPPVATEF